jgi:hypothetical protein
LCLGPCSKTASKFFVRELPIDDIFGATAFPVWDELIINNGTSQGIYYTIYGNTPNRTVIFEYYATRRQQPEQYCHFQILFFEANPGVVQFIYLDVPYKGKSAIIGVQGKSSYE